MDTSPPPILVQLVPLFMLLFVSFSLAIVLFFIARRKGRSGALALLALIPIVNMLVAIWLCSLTDISVLNELERLKRKDGKV
jgi:hypothetical protein